MCTYRVVLAAVLETDESVAHLPPKKACRGTSPERENLRFSASDVCATAQRATQTQLLGTGSERGH
jgi:hypothetical protein